MKGGADFTPSDARARMLPEYCKLCGWALALAHAKSGDPALIAGYLGKGEEFDDAIARFAVAYGAQTDRDHAALARAAKEKRITVAKTV
jgi:NAD(P)H-dependent flavin oxidoreductase YrpB (nitropropane dioxygenase family)